jgi:hypothetical protein
MFRYVSTKPVKVRIPSTATASYDSTSYIDTDTTTDNWGNAFRGKGWDGTNYLTGEVNANINLTFETYTP